MFWVSLPACTWLPFFPADDPTTVPEDTGTPAITTVPEPPPPILASCPAMSGFDEVGRTWTWQYTDAYVSLNDLAGTWTEELVVLDATADAVDVQLHAEASYEFPDFENYTGTIDTVYRCDAQGLWLTSTLNAFSYTYNGTPREGTVEVTFTKPRLRLPADADRGSTWEWRAQAEVSAVPGGLSSFSEVGSGAIPFTAVVDVPAGEFPEAYAAQYTLQDVTTTEYLVDGVGWVYTGVAELLEYTLPK